MKVYVVTEYGGSYDDKWEIVVGVFESKEAANKAIKKEYGDKLICNEKTGEKHVKDEYWGDYIHFRIERFEIGKYKYSEEGNE